MDALITIRQANAETDLPGITQLINHFEDEPVSVEDVRSWFKDYSAPEYFTRRLVSLDEHGEISGYSRMMHDQSAPEHHFRVWLCVDPAHQGRGIGSALWNASRAYLQSQHATRVSSEVNDQDAQALAFAEHRGFKIHCQLFHSALDLAAFDESPYLAAIASLEAQGIRFCSLANFPDTPENRRKLFDLNAAAVLDIPGVTSLPWTFEEFEKFIFGGSWFRRDGQLLAVDGDTWVGLSAVSLNPAASSAYNEHTGVMKAYRGRKIAQALKVKAACYARQNGSRLLRTHNNSLNAPILAINRKMGYQPLPGSKYAIVCWLNTQSPEEA